MTKGKSHRPKALFQVSNVLWHLDIFRRSFRDLSGHACMADSCIFCALKELFSQLQFSPETALPPDALRRALAESFFDQQRFQLGFMDDAAECFENMLLRIHQHVAHGQSEDACAAPHCVPHQKFAMTLVEQAACGNCGATSEPLSYTQMVHYVSTSTLVYQVRANAGRQNCSDPFGKLLQKAGNMGDIRQCPSACGSVIQIGRTLMNHPEIVSVGLVWNSERPTLEHIMEVFSSIGTSLRLGDVFNSVVDSRYADTSIHNLVGVVTYYGKHYSTFFFHTKLRVWIYFDDATVREVGPRWEQVVEKCRKGRYQPLLLLYSSPDGTPVNTENAPKQITPFYTDKTKAKSIVNNQQLLRRSVTPSPEKPIIGNTRRAITPNPDSSLLNQKPPLPRPYNEYQNLSVIQKNIYPSYESQGVDQVDGCVTKKEPEYVTKRSLDFGKPQVHRTLSNSSSSGVEGMCIPDHLNLPRRRDSGNWSGDRNSASSASSTTMENPYLYLVGKMPHGGGSVPSSPTRIKSDSSSGSSGVYDAGYDSYSLSSNDSSSMSTLQHLMKMGHLAKIPEDYTNVNLNQVSQSCDVLCDEADELLVKSRQLEDEHDLVLALALCNAAATKARAAMNAPYNNPQTLTLARMKHNTCIMRARSLHRRMTQSLSQNKDKPLEIRHTREGSSGSGRHSRQNSREKGQHSRQSSRELLLQQEKEKPRPTKSIEIYATLPKKKDALKTKINAINIDDAEYMLYDKLPERESRSIFSRSKNKDNKIKEKRSRSEDRNKLSRGDFSIASEVLTGKDTLKKAKESKEKEDKKDKDGKPKKQHKIRRKLLMGGLIRRKNRSMPDLTDADAEDKSQVPLCITADDSNLGLRGSDEPNQALSGYLSEGHLEFSGNKANPNLERSKLMRKSFHCSAGKILTAAKVPPPPPLRTTSQLSKSKSDVSGEVIEHCDDRQQFNLYGEVNHYHNLGPYNQPHEEQSMSLPYYHNQNSSYDDESFLNASSHTVITHADVHQEQSFLTSPTSNIDSGVDEVDCLPSHSAPMLELPPYPSPMGSAIHSRQASEDFPPPPPPIDLSALEEYLPKPSQNYSNGPPEPNSLLAQLQNKRQQILSPENEAQKLMLQSLPANTLRSSGDVWLKELQAKQAALKMKKNEIPEVQQTGIDEVNTQRYLPGEAKVKSVKDLASKFEYSDASSASLKPVPSAKPYEPIKSTLNINNNHTVRNSEVSTIAPEQIAEEIREVEMITSAVNKVFGSSQETDEDGKKIKLGKKKSVSFCDQVILVATAEEQEDDTYIPNPILERVLRSAVNKPEAVAIRQEIISKRDQNNVSQPLVNQNADSAQQIVNNSSPLSTNPLSVPLNNDVEQPLYIRRNSIENLLNKQNGSEPHDPPKYSIQQYSYSGQTTPVQTYPLYSQSAQPYPTTQSSSHELDMMPDQQYYTYGTNMSASSNNYLNQISQSTNNSPVLASIHNQYNSSPQTLNNGYYSLAQNNNQTPLNSTQINPQFIRQNDMQQFKQALPIEQQYKVYQTPPYIPNQNYGTVPGSSPSPQHPYSSEFISQHHNGGNYGKMQQNGHYIEQRVEPSTPYRQSPYQSIPLNSPVHPAYYGNNRLPPKNGQDYNNHNYAPSLKPHYNQPQIRQSTPSPIGHPSSSPYNNPPSPAPSSINSSYNYHPAMYRGPVNNNVNQVMYQRVSPLNDYSQTPCYGDLHQQRQMPSQERNDIYQRVPPPHGDESVHQHGGKYSPYQQVPNPKQILKKTVSFEPGTKGCESPIPKAIVTPIIVNNANNSVPTDKTKCNLCRKKNVVSLNLYCTDCEFYMSRFKPRS